MVVSQSLDPGATVPQGTIITIKVSTGETPEGKLPDFTGMTVDEALDVFSLEDLADAMPSELTQGQRKLVAKALVGRLDQVG